jgi:hypothetical protein
MNALINSTLPSLIFLATIFNLLLRLNGLPYIYVGLVAIGIILVLCRGVRLTRNDVLVLAFVAFYVVISSAKAIYYNEVSVVILAVGQYILFPVYWLLLFRCRSGFEIDPFLRQTIKWVVLIAVGAMLQYYFSPTLFGYLQEVESNNLAWSQEVGLDIYGVFFRATSFLSSPQVFGLFTALYVFIIGRSESRFKPILLLLVMVAAIHSGNKISILVLACYGVFVVLGLMRHRRFLSIALVGILAIVAGVVVLELAFKVNFSIINRHLSLSAIAEEERDGRLRIYAELLQSRDVLLGEFPGFFMSSSSHNTQVSESYLLQILIENGLVYFLAFLGFYFYILVKRKYLIAREYVWLALVLFPCLVFSHAFTDPVFFVFWGILLYLFTCRSGVSIGRRQGALADKI